MSGGVHLTFEERERLAAFKAEGLRACLKTKYLIC